MIKRILIAIVVTFFLLFCLLWILGGGSANVRAAVDHYRNPFKYHDVLDYLFQIGSTTGETFKLPGAPSTFPTPTLPTQSTSTVRSDSGADSYSAGNNAGQDQDPGTTQ